MLLLYMKTVVRESYNFERQQQIRRKRRRRSKSRSRRLQVEEAEEDKADAAEDVRSRGGRLQKGAAYRCVVVISPREARIKFSPSFFSYQDGLSWHLHALY